MVPQTISTAQLTAILFAIKGHKFLTITTETEPRMRKTSNPYFVNGQCVLIKRTTANVSMNFEYANVVNNRRAKEGNEEKFVPQPRKWGERVPGTCFVQHQGAMYMELHYKSEPSVVEYIDTRNNTTVPAADVEQWLQTRSSNAEHQGLEKEVILRDVKIQNIRECKVNGAHYVIR
jgi:hypothetical protein